MADRAHVTSIDELEKFRSRVIVYVERATQALDELTEDISRTRVWVKSDQRMHWEHEIKRRGRVLELAEADLRGARISSLGEATALHEARVKQAKMALKEAEEKRAIVRKWDRHYDGQVDPLMKQVNKLDNYLNTDMPKAIQFLTGAIKALADYAETAAPSLEDGAPAAPAPDDEEEAGSPEA